MQLLISSEQNYRAREIGGEAIFIPVLGVPTKSVSSSSSSSEAGTQSPSSPYPPPLPLFSLTSKQIDGHTTVGLC